MKTLPKIILSSILVVAVVIIGVFLVYFQSSQDAPPTIPRVYFIDYAIKENVVFGRTGYHLIVTTGQHKFWCNYRTESQSNCRVVVSDVDGNNGKFVDVESIDDTTSIIPSPNGKNIVVVYSQKVILLDTTTLTKKIIFEVPTNQTLGTHSEIPSFHGEANWIDNNSISVSVYDMNDTGDLPLFKNVIKI